MQFGIRSFFGIEVGWDLRVFLCWLWYLYCCHYQGLVAGNMFRLIYTTMEWPMFVNILLVLMPLLSVAMIITLKQ